MNLWSIINIVLNFITLINSISSTIICLLIFLLVIIFHRQTLTVPLLLACHTCLTLLISSIMLASMATSSLFGFFGIVMQQHGNTKWCHWRGFLIHAVLCVLYDSYILQATYRLFRVVFYRQRILHNFLLYCVIIFIASLFGLISISPVIIRGDIIYLSSEYYCQTPFTNISAIMYIAIRLFLLPILLIAIIYIFLLNHIRQTRFLCNNYHRRSKHNRRNLIVIRRLLLMLTFLISLGFPSMIFLIILIFTGHLVLLTYRVGWLFVSFSLIFLSYMLIQLTRPLKKTMRKFLRCETS
ncbi:unnamed protein product [Rotaria sordida]|uniref:G-protein coupled receptors family 1 profile domain-containing protein n=1 Tax=Rotaria sordida TaxID=392033 RepID=A0A818S7Y4_9BILA|nr:unnamed protein product [Rotaria sordida]